MNAGHTLFSTLTLSDGTVFHLVHNAHKGSSLSSAHDAIYKRLRDSFTLGEHSAMCPVGSFETCYLSAHLTEQFVSLVKAAPKQELTAEYLQTVHFSHLVHLIKRDWKKVNYAAVPYLQAMCEMENPKDSYGSDSGKSIVLYFLGNATSWRGDVARAIKAELKRRIK